jgi:hypothetical protein
MWPIKARHNYLVGIRIVGCAVDADRPAATGIITFCHTPGPFVCASG